MLKEGRGRAGSGEAGRFKTGTAAAEYDPSYSKLTRIQGEIDALGLLDHRPCAGDF